MSDKFAPIGARAPTDEERARAQREVEFSEKLNRKAARWKLGTASTLRGDAGLLEDVARGLVAQVRDAKIEFPVTFKLENAEVYISGNYGGNEKVATVVRIELRKEVSEDGKVESSERA